MRTNWIIRCIGSGGNGTTYKCRDHAANAGQVEGCAGAVAAGGRADEAAEDDGHAADGADDDAVVGKEVGLGGVN